MQVGDLVKAIYLSADCGLLGVIVARVPVRTGNPVFRVLWTNGSISERMWDYDLEKVSA